MGRRGTGLIVSGDLHSARRAAAHYAMCEHSLCANTQFKSVKVVLTSHRTTIAIYSAEREESTFLIFSVFSSYLHHTIGYGQKQHMTVILNLY